MSASKVGCLVVSEEDGRFAGIITERDIVDGVLASCLDPDSTTVGQIMTAQVVCCSAETPTSEARRMMAENGIRHLPVVQDGVVVGMLSARDLMARQLLEDRAAAEEVAMLSRCIKSIEVNEVAEIVSRELPKLFQAERCVLYLDKASDPSGKPVLMSYNNCVCAEEGPGGLDRAAGAYARAGLRYEQIPDYCGERGARSPRLVIPLEVGGDTGARDEPVAGLMGYVCMCGLASGKGWNEELILYKARLAREILTSHLNNARLYQQVRLSSLTDPLTGVGSRKLLEDKLQAECVRAKRYGRPFSIAIIDLDNFKMINDVLGHAAGDEALVRLCACMKAQKRAADTLARYGGDEFVILMPETKASAAVKLMSRVRSKAHEIKLSDNIWITISCGVAQSPAENLNTAREIMRRADVALYEAKSAGRDCVKIWDEKMSRQIGASDLEVEKIKELQRRIGGLSERAEKMFVESICGLVQALEAKDAYAKRHSENVTRYAVGIGRSMRVSRRQLEIIRRASMIHDIGKIGVPDTILSKAGRLTPRERAIVEQHPLIAVRILEKMTFLKEEIELVRHHHEKWNGRGYPDGLSGTSIPFGARLIAVADSFDALSSARSYRGSRCVGEAMKVVTDSCGHDFDPKVVAGLVEWVESVAAAVHKGLEELTTEDLLSFEARRSDEAGASARRAVAGTGV